MYIFRERGMMMNAVFAGDAEIGSDAVFAADSGLGSDAVFAADQKSATMQFSLPISQ